METSSTSYNNYISEIQEIENYSISLKEKYIKLKCILERHCKEITREETLQFSSLFSRIVFISQKYNLPKQLEWQLQNIRKKASWLNKNEHNIISTTDYEKIKSYLIYFISIIYNNRVGEYPPLKEEENLPIISTINEKIRAQVVSIDIKHKLIKVHIDSVDNSEIIIRYDVPKVNDIFNRTIEDIWIGAQLNLINCTQENHTDYLVPQYIVLEPDYLIDTSALAECFQNYGKSHFHYFRRKFESATNSHYILLGNLANYFLDELIYSDNPQNVSFDEVFLRSFKLYPFEFTSCNDIKSRSDFMIFMAKAKTQFNNIKRVIDSDFTVNNIQTKDCTLEPSFFCEQYGFQGRLDLLQLTDNENEKIKIIELKSGSLPFPKDDPGRISMNHEAQTTIYRLIIESVFDKQSRDISSNILYSAAENKGENIRFSAKYQVLEKEIINIRNLIVATEYKLYLGENNEIEEIFTQMFNLNSYGNNVPQFFIDRLSDIEKVIANSTELEKAYFFRFIKFISRELYIHKIGDVDYDSYTGISSLWQTDFKDRKESFNLISDLQIIEIDDSEADMKILFKRNQNEDFVNFRVGEICILYPHDNEEDNILSNQILKGTIAEIQNDKILIRFRYKQKNKQYLSEHKLWVVEHDRLDHSYNTMFKLMFTFLKTSITKKALLLGIDKPNSDYKSESNKISSQISKQHEIIDKALAAKDYFFIVGPPGTGKTSIFARNLIERLHSDTSDNTLILAYTNRAVDELCESIHSVFASENEKCNEYIRIGTDLSCSAPYKHRLLQNIAKDVKSRDELRSIINDCRIFVGTLASITGKPELFDIKKFNVAIIDEASQILEPQIVGLLTHFDKFIMIGDHKQLSTITLQSENKSKITDTELNSIELVDCRESYFERMYRICIKNSWDFAYDTLIYQGRMHKDIAYYANKYFYNNELKIANLWQEEDLIRKIDNNSDIYQQITASKRIAFIAPQNFEYSANDKINESEADIAVKLCQSILDVYYTNNIPFDENKTLGIIAPYRNQIALIKHKLEQTNIPILQNIMIDTVERFQGSQRDIIILSFCMNQSYQLNFFSSLNREKTVDRKLNVAITRARHQLFLIGNPYILRQNKIYNEILGELEIIHL